MIPIKLSIQGLYSYQGLQEIDFRQLVGSSVFGIFGKVGSGKTSLLEAISFALYGETERLNSRDNRQYNMMNLKSKHLMIDFEFQAGPDEQLYRFVYEAKRHPKKHQEISSSERRMFIRQSNEWHPIGNEKEDVAILSKQILGLDYDNFKRTIIIPQNQFREFLELSPTDRTKMMNQLFKLDQYDLAARVSKLSKANDDQLSELRGLLAPLADVNLEAIEQADLDISAVSVSLRQKEDEINRLVPVENQLLDNQKRSKTLVSMQEELALLLTKEPAYQQREQDLAVFESCLLIFQADFANLDKLQAKKQKLTESVGSAQQQLNLVTKRLVGLQNVFEAAKQAYETREELQQKADELDTVQQIRTLHQSIGQQTRNQTLLTGQLSELVGQLDRFKTDRANHQRLLDAAIGRTSDMERFYKVKDWFTAYKPLKKQADDLQLAVEKYDLAIAALKQEKDKALEGFPSDWAALNLKTLPDAIEQALVKFKAARQDRETKHRQLMVQDGLRRYADALHDGSPCPLCGSEHHPNRHTGDAYTVDVQQSEAALNNVDRKIEVTTALQLIIKELTTKLRSELENGKRLNQERGDVLQRLIEHEDTFIWPEFSRDQEGQVVEAIQKESDTQKQIQDAQQAIRTIDARIGETETAHNRLAQQVVDVGNAISGLNGQLKTAAESLDHFRLDEVKNWAIDQINDLRNSLTKAYAQVKVHYDNASKQKGDTEKELATVEEQIQQLQNQLAEVIAELDSLEATIEQNLIHQNLTRDQARQILRSGLDVTQEKQAIKEYNERRSGLQLQVGNLETELAEHPFDPVALETIQQQLAVVQAEKDALNKEHGRATSVLESLKTQWKQKKDHQKRHDALELRRQDLKKMDEMFRAQGFVNYVSSVYLKNLCESANERFFKLTNNQLKLELDEKNNFLVRDYLNGGDVRSVKTLSGGQTFQAALSLALALSDNIQHLTKAKQNLFFLDEGFGTLDKDALQTVFKTLKALRSENRVVGIISHVEELQHEVDNYIRAESTDEGSRIFRSWEK
ncbi:AAA family ATPase [Spirosoma utsteinense]|uniref:Exonuclease SbcC n=1 Tax=Spirosoma utsteinense TaxID=2585773 RepID=A0ABR6W6N2_9BACT|nr:SMC family ATPase [Spirosoma utsteinense]MBC3785501.1 exonuclease SbcC [Spirosoma utsteinense]MBC3791470.1 exonuclease SbcC [Spirosoma utsteinense]